MTDSAPIASLRDVGKLYGKRWALRHVNLELSPGEIVGFIGPNGAGKTTLMRIIAGLSLPTEGQLTVLGSAMGGKELQTPVGIGLVLEQMGFIAHISGKANLEMLAGLRRVASAATIVQTLQQVGLDPNDTRPVRTYSLGMRQRLCLAQALMEKPRLLLLDEPTNGLDPAGIVDLRKLLTDVAAEGTTIFLASHMLTEVERICHRVLLVRAGEILKDLDLRHTGPSRIRLVVAREKDVETVLQSGITAERMAGESELPTLLLTPDATIPELVRRLVTMGVDIEEISAEKQSLEKEFLTLFR
ncbi:MAG: ABC transporter ATP-binding protein [Polyangiaceae bacterium]|nr:ABC transporter ATP-binding protein [Polyangiaceae bacterium]